MLCLPPVPPTVGWRRSLRLSRAYYVRLDANDYSVDPAAVGRRVEMVADLDRVRAFYQGRPVAVHEPCWAVPTSTNYLLLADQRDDQTGDRADQYG